MRAAPGPQLSLPLPPQLLAIPVHCGGVPKTVMPATIRAEPEQGWAITVVSSLGHGSELQTWTKSVQSYCLTGESEQVS